MLFRPWEDLGAGSFPGTGAASGSSVTTVGDPRAGGHVLVAGHAEIRRILADPETFRPDNALDAVTPIPVAALRILTRYGFRLPPTLANNGTPSHPAIRSIMAEALRPDRVAGQRPWLTGVVRRRVAALTRALRDGRPTDLYADLVADLPLLVLARLVELPPSDVDVVKEFSRAALELFWAPLDAARQSELAEVVGRYHATLRAFAGTVAAGGGVLGRLAAGQPADVVVGALFFLLVAGQETTSQFLTILLHRLLSEPAVVSSIVDGSVAVADVVEEGLRLEPPIVTWRRITARDTGIGDLKVPAGASVVLRLAAAGRDRSVVDRPDDFVPGQRGSRRHLAFGAGAHRCIGAQLSRMEAAVVVEETAPLLRRARLRRGPSYPDNLSFRMPDVLLIS